MIKICCDKCGREMTDKLYRVPIHCKKVNQKGYGKIIGYLGGARVICEDCLDVMEQLTGDDEPVAKKGINNGRPATVDKDKIVSLSKAGWSASQIADEVKCGKSTVTRLISEYKNGRSGS